MEVKNVVIVNDFNYVQGGASKVAIDTAKILQKAGLKIYFFSAVNKDEENLDGINYISTYQNEALKEKNKLKGIINGIYNFKARKKLKKLLNTLDRQETIIHIHGWTKALSSSVFDIAFKMKFKVVLTLHDYFTACPNGGYFDYKENMICKRKPLSWECIKCNCDSRNYGYKLYRILRQLVQNSIVGVNKKLKYVIGISDLNIKVLSQTLNSNVKIKKIFNPIEISNNFKVNPNENKDYLFIARISKDKGIDIFCKVITELGYNGIAIGEGIELERVKKQYPNINFVGWQNKENVKKYMLKARCVIFPSLWYEGAPLTPLESMSYGIPCLISDSCAGREYYPNNNFSNYQELKNKLKKINDNYIDICEYKILDEFKHKKYKENLVMYYKEVLNNE